MKKNQNSFGEISIIGLGKCKWNTTNKVLQIFFKGKLIGESRVVREKDFDFEAMKMFALSSSNLKAV